MRPFIEKLCNAVKDRGICTFWNTPYTPLIKVDDLIIGHFQEVPALHLKYSETDLLAILDIEEDENAEYSKAEDIAKERSKNAIIDRITKLWKNNS